MAEASGAGQGQKLPKEKVRKNTWWRKEWDKCSWFIFCWVQLYRWWKINENHLNQRSCWPSCFNLERNDVNTAVTRAEGPRQKHLISQEGIGTSSCPPPATKWRIYIGAYRSAAEKTNLDVHEFVFDAGRTHTIPLLPSDCSKLSRPNLGWVHLVWLVRSREKNTKPDGTAETTPLWPLGLTGKQIQHGMSPYALYFYFKYVTRQMIGGKHLECGSTKLIVEKEWIQQT